MTRQLEQLIQTLLTKTRSGAITWSPTDDPEAFVYSNASASIILDRADSINLWPRLRVIDANGSLAEEVVDASATGALSQLMHLVAEQRRNASKVIDSFLRELQAV